MKSEKSILYSLLGLFALLSFFFTYFFINPELHYHNQQIAWHSDKIFFDYYLTFPGGIVEYLALFISQWFVFKWVGSFIIAISGLLISFFLFKTISLKWNSNRLLFLLIPIIQVLYLALMCDYRYNFSITLNLLIVAGILLVNTAINKKQGYVNTLLTVLGGILVYIISGGMYFLIFMLSSIILLFKRPNLNTILNILLIIGAGFLVPYVAYHFVYLTSLKSSFFRSTPDVAVMIRYSKPLLFKLSLASIPVILLMAKLATLYTVPKSKTEQVKSKKDKTKKDNNVSTPNQNKLLIGFGIQVFVLIGLSWYLLSREYNPIEKAKIEIDFHAYHQNWEEVIAMSERFEDYDRMVNFQFNRALLNTEQVLDKLFEYNQKLGVLGLFLDRPFTAEITLPSSDLYFDLGNIDESLRYAFESETLMKNSPRVLKRLILNCIIMDKMEAAKTYLNILASNPIEKEWVSKYYQFANDPQLAAADPLIISKRKNMNKAEGINITPPEKLLQQLGKNPGNKGAIEYLIAIDLMEHDMSALLQDFKFIRNLNYKKLPLIIEEAVILFRSQGNRNDFLNSIPISESTTNRFKEFASLTNANKGNREKAQQATIDFRNTYWYYVLFLSPKVTNLNLTTSPVDNNY